MKAIRNSVKAIILQDERLLLTKNKDDWGFFYLLPGGGQEPGENMYQALIRECMEEISCEIEIGDIRYIRDYIGKNHEFADFDQHTHQIEYMFECSLKASSDPQNGNVPDGAQIGVEWVPIDQLGNIRLYPSILKNLIKKDGLQPDIIYLGDVN